MTLYEILVILFNTLSQSLALYLNIAIFNYIIHSGCRITAAVYAAQKVAGGVIAPPLFRKEGRAPLEQNLM